MNNFLRPFSLEKHAHNQQIGPASRKHRIGEITGIKIERKKEQER